MLPGLRRGASDVRKWATAGLRGVWALPPWATAAGAVEAMLIEDEARGLGMPFALLVEPARPMCQADVLAVAGVEFLLFQAAADRDVALRAAEQHLPGAGAFRGRFRFAPTGADVVEMLAAKRPDRPPEEPGEAPKRVFYWTGLSVTQSFNTGVQRVVRELGSALLGLGVALVPVKLDDARGRMAALSRAEAEHLAKWNEPSIQPDPELPTSLDRMFMAGRVARPCGM